MNTPCFADQAAREYAAEEAAHDAWDQAVADRCIRHTEHQTIDSLIRDRSIPIHLREELEQVAWRIAEAELKQEAEEC